MTEFQHLYLNIVEEPILAFMFYLSWYFLVYGEMAGGGFKVEIWNSLSSSKTKSLFMYFLKIGIIHVEMVAVSFKTDLTEVNIYSRTLFSPPAGSLPIPVSWAAS